MQLYSETARAPPGKGSDNAPLFIHRNEHKKGTMRPRNEKPDRILLTDITKALATAQVKSAQQSQRPKNRPAHTIEHGLVVTRIWANTSPMGERYWSVDQRRYRASYNGEADCKSFHPQHLSDAICGLVEARQWIKKTERRLRWKRFWF